MAEAPVTNAPNTINIVLRTTLPPATLRTNIEAIVHLGAISSTMETDVDLIVDDTGK